MPKIQNGRDGEVSCPRAVIINSPGYYLVIIFGRPLLPSAWTPLVQIKGSSFGIFYGSESMTTELCVIAYFDSDD